MRVLRSQVQYINSLDRNDGENIGNFTVTWPNNFIPVHADELVRMSLVSFSTYNYFYWTNRYNNAFNINGQVYFLPIGFCTPEDNLDNFCSLLNLEILPRLPGYVSGSVSWTYLLTSPSLDYPGYNDNVQPQYRVVFTNGANIPFNLSFEGAAPNYSKLNGALLLGFNPGGNYTTIASINPLEVPYVFTFPANGTIDSTCAPISGKLQNIVLEMSVPPKNVAFDIKTGYLNFTPTFAYIPALAEPFDPIVYTPQDTGAWTWQSPSKGGKLGTIRYRMLTPAYDALLMVADYTLAIRVDFLVDDVVEQMKLMRQSLHFQKLLLIQNDQHHQDAQPEEETDEPEEPQGGDQAPDTTGGVQETEDQLHEGNLDFYGGNNLFDD